jgi:hypothetical protein
MLKSIVLLLSLAGVLNCQEIYVEIGPGQQELKSYIKTFAAGHVDKYVIQVYTPDGQISSDTVSEWPSRFLMKKILKCLMWWWLTGQL